jgi:antitoxin (DNA-binding transcriptional repressor) of toxin-antitoxin stability system
MRTVGIRELKNRLSEYLRLVRAGEEVLVTDRDEVVAELKRPDENELHSLPAGLRELIRRGSVTPGSKNDPELYPLLKRLSPKQLFLKLLKEERGEH